MAQGQATTNFTDAGSAGVDLGTKYVTKDYLMTYYPGLTTAMKAPAVWTWGINTSGQLGTGSTTSVTSPGTVLGIGQTWLQVSAGQGHTAAVKTDGTLWTWGNNSKGNLGSGTTTATSSPVTVAGGGTTWSSVSAGYQITAAIKTDGTLWTCGYNNYGQLGNNSTVNTSSFATTAGGGTTWSQVSVYGTSFSGLLAAIKTDGTLWTCGYGTGGGLGNGSTANTSSPGQVAGGGTNWAQVSCGYNAFTAAVKTDGTLWTCGYNAVGQLGNGSTTNTSSPGTVSGGGTTWSQVSCGGNFIAAIKTDGTLWSWGQNGSGQLGTGNFTNYSSPVTIAGGGTTWKQVSTGQLGGAAVKTDGTLWTWGRGTAGLLGNGSTAITSSPGTTTLGGTNWKQVSTKFHCIAIAEAQGY
jgi:alpha-tubulin suppressor-like RCC1 family protein